MTGRLLTGLVALLVAGLLAIGIVAALGWSQYRAFQAQALDTGGEPVRIRVRSGDSVAAVIDRLETRGLTEHDWRWRLLLWLEPVTIQAGEYELPPAVTPGALLEQLASGRVIQYRFTLVEGWNWVQLRAALLADERLRVPPEQLATDAVMGLLGSDATHPEGWFLPETWAFTAEDDALDVLRRAHAAMREVLANAWAARDPALPLDTPYELLTLASIVEKETAIATEREEVAGVFVRRLRQNWRLETDPTVIYGMGEAFDGNIRRRDLRRDTPYNTYTRRGLPPTPIAMPGAATLRATAHPAEGTAMFFVANGKGGHVFSDTLEEHNAAVQALIRFQRNGGDMPAPTDSTREPVDVATENGGAPAP